MNQAGLPSKDLKYKSEPRRDVYATNTELGDISVQR